MKIYKVKVEARNAPDYSLITVHEPDLGKIFNFDGVHKPIRENEAEFIAGVGLDWVRVPPELLDPITARNFYYEIKEV